MPQRICTFSNCFSAYPDSYTQNLFGTFSGHSTLIDLARTSLKIADYAHGSEDATHDKLNHAINLLGNAKVLLGFAKIPKDIASIFNHGNQSQISCQTLHRKYQLAEEIEKQDILLVILSIAGLIQKILSCVGRLLVKPTAMINQSVDLGPEVHTALGAWQYVSLAKSGTKITYYGCKCLTEPLKLSRMISLALELWSTVLAGLELGKVRVHPAVNLAYAITKTLFELYRLCEKTA